MRTLLAVLSVVALSSSAFASPVISKIVPYSQDNVRGQVVLKNDSFTDQGGQAYLQAGFIEGEKVGIYVRVPDTIKLFKIDYFRVLMTSNQALERTLVYFAMGITKDFAPSMPTEIENAAEVTPGNYWNDIPAQGEGQNTKLRCAGGGDLVGASLEFTQAGLPSVSRDLDGLSNPKANTLMAIPGGWNYSVVYGLRGDWILRVVGHEAADGECS